MTIHGRPRAYRGRRRDLDAADERAIRFCLFAAALAVALLIWGLT